MKIDFKNTIHILSKAVRDEAFEAYMQIFDKKFLEKLAETENKDAKAALRMAEFTDNLFRAGTDTEDESEMKILEYSRAMAILSNIAEEYNKENKDK